MKPRKRRRRNTGASKGEETEAIVTQEGRKGKQEGRQEGRRKELERTWKPKEGKAREKTPGEHNIKKRERNGSNSGPVRE